jgi:hypothetical protein
MTPAEVLAELEHFAPYMLTIVKDGIAAIEARIAGTTRAQAVAETRALNEAAVDTLEAATDKTT